MKKLLITGASSGLGKKITEHFSKNKFQIICIGKPYSKVHALKKKINKKENFYFSFDLTKDKNITTLIKKLKKIKNLDAIIHCMGGGLGIRENLVSKKNFMKLFNCNLFAQSEINNLFIKNSIKNRKSLKIIHISSVASLENIASIGYSSSKVALNIYSKMLAKKFVKNRIFVKNLILGGFETEDNSFGRLKLKNFKAYKDFIKKRMPLKRLSSAEEIIPIIEFVLTPSSEILSGDLVADNCELNTFRN